MRYCDDIKARLAFVLDDELSDGDKVVVEAHLRECSDCLRAFEAERGFLDNVRQSRPLFTAPVELRSRVERALTDATHPITAPQGLRRRLQNYLWGSCSSIRQRSLVAICLVLLLALVLVIWSSRTPSGTMTPHALSEFAVIAINTHERRVQGKLPLEITSDSPEEISAWFVGKVGFSLELPNYQEVSGKEKLYSLEGARLVAFKNDYAAHVAYNMRSRPITLVVTSNAVAAPRGGEQVVSRGLTFHCDAVNGLKVITWSDRGLTYALVSDLEERGQRSCVVCHQGATDRDFFESLKPTGF